MRSIALSTCHPPCWPPSTLPPLPTHPPTQPPSVYPSSLPSPIPIKGVSQGMPRALYSAFPMTTVHGQHFDTSSHKLHFQQGGTHGDRRRVPLPNPLHPSSLQEQRHLADSQSQRRKRSVSWKVNKPFWRKPCFAAPTYSKYFCPPQPTLGCNPQAAVH